MISTHTLVSIAAAAHKVKTEDGEVHDCSGYHCGQCKPLPAGCGTAWGAALVVPPPPDYSTPAEVTKRCREAGLWGSFADRHDGSKRVGAWWERDAAGFRKVYKGFRKAVPARAPCRVEDTHKSKWRVVDNKAPHGAYGDSAPDLALVPVVATKRRRKVSP